MSKPECRLPSRLVFDARIKLIRIMSGSQYSQFHYFHCDPTPLGWWRGTVVERRSLTGELSLSCARPAADG